MKKILALMLTALMVLCLFAGCTSEPASSQSGGEGTSGTAAGTVWSTVDSNEEYIVVNCLNNIEYFNAHKYMWEKCGELFGVKVSFTGPADDDMTVMCTAMDSAIAKNPAGICVWGYDAALDSYIVKAQEAGIPVVTFVGSTTEHGDCYIGTSQYDLGYNGGLLYAESIGGAGEVAILTILGSDMFEERAQGFEDAFAQYPNITIVAYGDTKADATTAINAAKDIAIKYPNLTGYVCTDSTGAQGASTALAELGLTGSVGVLGLDRNTETLQMVKDGTITGTLAQNDVAVAYWAFMTLFTANHVEIPLTSDNAAANAKIAPNYVYTSVNLVTVDNVDYYLAANDLYATNGF
ncbi:MAG: substrate-binding domain-containing protein [Clostridia bacterium]|nr:substrate-binding domain-containing protein [Clostridia bacterium]